jgi:hypothetical protein
VTRRGSGIERHRHVGSDLGQLAALPRVLRVAEQSLAIPLVRHVAGVRQQRLERTVARDQVARPLFADARHALDVVDRVSHQREHVHDLLRRDAELLLDAMPSCTSWKKSLSPVTIATSYPAAAAFTASVPMTSSAS